MNNESQPELGGPREKKYMFFVEVSEDGEEFEQEDELDISEWADSNAETVPLRIQKKEWATFLQALFKQPRYWSWKEVFENGNLFSLASGLNDYREDPSTLRKKVRQFLAEKFDWRADIAFDYLVASEREAAEKNEERIQRGERVIRGQKNRVKEAISEATERLAQKYFSETEAQERTEQRTSFVSQEPPQKEQERLSPEQKKQLNEKKGTLWPF
ncbi:MAG: hypothetical protein K9M51_04060 [Candidatus Gracilibacteria bacterium]|nr:hypothetical protein [Candidatus Gracilibacteria bacterium]